LCLQLWHTRTQAAAAIAWDLGCIAATTKAAVGSGSDRNFNLLVSAVDYAHARLSESAAHLANVAVRGDLDLATVCARMVCDVLVLDS
jgi:hypothetical protein